MHRLPVVEGLVAISNVPGLEVTVRKVKRFMNSSRLHRPLVCVVKKGRGCKIGRGGVTFCSTQAPQTCGAFNGGRVR